MAIYWFPRGKGQHGADGGDGEVECMAFQIEPVYSRSGKSIVGYEYYGFRINGPKLFQHEQLVHKGDGYPWCKPFATIAKAKEHAEGWYKWFFGHE